MSPWRSISWPAILMIGSLLLLAGFEYVWLNNTYHTQYALQEELQTQQLHGIVRDLEDSLFQVALLTDPEDHPDTLPCAEPQFKITRRVQGPDSMHVVAFLRTGQHAPRDTMHLQKRRFRKGTMALGGLIGHLSFDQDSATLAKSLEGILRAQIRELSVNPLQTQYQLIAWTDTLPTGQGIVSRAFYDIFSGRQYAISFPGYRGYLYRQMIPQILFAILLFASISGAFWMISHSLRRQQRLADMRSNLISNITHELKTPIATVNVALEALQNFDADADKTRRREYLSIAQSEINRLSLLVDKVLNSSQTENGRSELKLEYFNFRDMITRILDILKVRFAAVSADVHLTATDDDFTIEGDKTHLSGLVHNLVDNALKYGGQAPRIDIQLHAQNGDLLLTVADHGIGIPGAYRDRIYEKFFRVPSGDVHNTKGHGLGLSYVAQVVREHHGKIKVESTEGAGTAFLVILPKHHVN